MLAVSLLALALGLAMDAFAAAAAEGAARRGRSRPVRIALAFGLAQAAMPLLGWALGMALGAAIRAIDHWVALLVLGLLGARTIREGLRGDGGEPAPPLVGWALLAAAIATSIDAAAAGVTLPLLGAPIAVACATIGLVTAALAWGGVHLGAAAGARLGRRAEVLGGIVLIALGVKIFVEHQFFGG